jgi:RNA polymerase sigma factor (TIGR02999 family)
VPTLSELLGAVNRGEHGAIDRLFAALYEEMRSIAHARLRRQARITFLDTTALVNECYLRLQKVGSLELVDQAHFLGYAARAMRSIVVDFVRRRQSERRGGDLQREPLATDAAAPPDRREEEILRVHEALLELAEIDERLVRVVEMRYFAGMKEEEVAEALDVSLRTVARDWEKARLFLAASLG